MKNITAAVPGTVCDGDPSEAGCDLTMFRVVCMKHKVQCVGQLELWPVESEGEKHAFEWDTDNVTCQQMETEQKELKQAVSQFPGNLRVPNAELQKRMDEADCSERWYVVDETGLPVYMEIDPEDRPAFAAAKDGTDWRENLGILA